MAHICYNCFCESMDENGICTACGFDAGVNKEKYPLALPAGSILNGRYIVGKVLGQGGFGITYLAQDYQTKELVAIKEFFPDAMATRISGTQIIPMSGERGDNFRYGLETFLEEAKTMAEFNDNPNVVSVLVYFEENGTGYYAMEYVDGCSFDAYIKERGGRISWDETMTVMLPVLNALGAVHQKGIIHRDVTPDNIFVTSDGTVKLLDFGAARHSLGDVSRSLDVILKHGFAPKEQYSRKGRQGPYTDIYATGATIYYAITGTKPEDAIERFSEDTLAIPSDLKNQIQPWQEKVLRKSLAVEAADRYQTAVQMVDAINSGKNIPKESSRKNRVPHQKKKATARIFLGVAAAAVLCIAVGAYLYMQFHPHRYGELQLVKNATCDEEGYKEQQCFCGDIRTEVIPAKGHSYGAWHVAVQPGCETMGTSQRQCYCGDIQAEPIPATGHSQAISAGYVSCSGCGEKYYPVMKKMEYTKDYGWDFWETTYDRRDVKIITFRDTLEGAPANAFDFSESQDRSILCWLSGNDLIIAADTKIVANPDCSNLFRRFDNLKAIHFNNCFDTSFVKDMTGMFSLNNFTTLDLSSFDTSNVTAMDMMFTCCYYLTDMDLSNFDTSKVESAQAMFNMCYKLKNLDLSSFDTSNGMTVPFIFNKCRKLTNLVCSDTVILEEYRNRN